MATTTEKQLSGAWEAVATGGDVLLSLPFQHDGSQVRYAFADSAVTAPTVNYGHPLNDDKDVPMTLAAGETLWLRGDDLVVITATQPV